MRQWLLIVLLGGTGQFCRGDTFVFGPTPPPGPIGGPTQTGTIYPFLIKEILAGPTAPKPTMRYQQVYNASLFTNLDPGLIYVTTLTFSPDITEKPFLGWTIPEMQINLSTTPKTADTLSLVFA